MLLNCLKKLGKTITSTERAELESAFNDHVAGGMSEYDAGMAALAGYHKGLFESVNELRSATNLQPVEYREPSVGRERVEGVKEEQRGTQSEIKPTVETQREAVESAVTPDVAQQATRNMADKRTTRTSEPADAAPITPQKFYHRDFGEVVRLEDQSGARRGKTKVVEADNPDAIHYVKTAQLTGAGNQRMVPLKSEVSEPNVESYLEQKGEPPPNDIASTQPPGEAQPIATSQTPGRETAPVTKEPQSTAPKNAAMQADRESLGLPELERVKGASAQEVLDKAKQANTTDPRRPDILVEQALRGGRNFTDTETMQVNLRAAEVKNRVAELQKELASTTDPATITDKATELDTLINEFDRLSQAQRKSGTEWGRAGIARQRAIDEDFSLVSMVAKFRKDARRVETVSERAEIERLHARNTELESQLAEANDRAASRSIQKQLDKATRRRERNETKAALDVEAATIKSNIAAELARLRSASTGTFSAGGLGALDPEGVITREVLKYVRNRAKAEVGLRAEALVDEVHVLLSDLKVDKRTVRDLISGYSIGPKTTRSETQKRLDTLRNELKSLSKSEDIAAGRRSPRQEGPQAEFQRDQARQRAISKEITDLERRMAESDFSEKPRRDPPRYTRETARLQRQLEENRIAYHKLRYKATRSPLLRVGDELVAASNVPKTIKSVGDISAVFRQGGYLAITHPVEGLLKPTLAMKQAITDAGWRNVENAIKDHPKYEQARKDGVEFTGVDAADATLTKRDEGYLGGETIDKIAKGRFNPLRAVKGVKDFSEHTFNAFLDSQRMNVYDVMTEGLADPGLLARTLGAKKGTATDADRVRIAKAINSATGRGNLDAQIGPLHLKANQFAPALNVLMFSPRLLKSRVELLNNMFNPVAWRNMPANARGQILADNIKFIGAVTATMALAKAAGASVSLDPDDSEFLKIRFGDTVYDNLTGLQQPLRFIVNMSRAISADITGNDTYAGESKANLTYRFGRSKLAPLAGAAEDWRSGEDFQGRKFSARRTGIDLLTPLPSKDIIEGFQQSGLLGAVKATPTLTGIGVGSYPPAAEKPTTHAEKLARKFFVSGLPDEARDAEQVDIDRRKSFLRARARKGQPYAADLARMEQRGEITSGQAKRVRGAAGETRLNEDLKALDADEALRVFSVMTPSEKRRSSASIRGKIENSKADARKKEGFRRRARELGLTQ